MALVVVVDFNIKIFTKIRQARYTSNLKDGYWIRLFYLPLANYFRQKYIFTLFTNSKFVLYLPSCIYIFGLIADNRISDRISDSPWHGDGKNPGESRCCGGRRDGGGWR